MSQVLAFTERDEFRKKLDLECKGVTGFSPIFHDSLQDLEQMLHLLQKVDVVIVDRPRGEWNPQFFLDRVIAGPLKIQNLLLLGWDGPQTHSIKFFPSNATEQLIKCFKEIIGHKESAAVGWCSMPLHALHHFKSVPFDLYVKLNEAKFVKRIPAHEQVDEVTIEDFKSRGINEIFFSKADNKLFSQMLINNMINQIDLGYDSIDSTLKARSQVLLTVREIVQQIGLKERVVEVCDTMISAISQDIYRGNDEFARYLSSLKTNPHLAFKHRFIELTCFIGGQLIFGLQGKNREDQINCFVYAAFFSDIALLDADSLHFFQSDRMSHLDMVKKREINEHAYKAAQLIRSCKTAPPEVATIIMQHHGALDGIGLPTKKSAQLVPLAKCLIISQELAYGLLTDSDRPALDQLRQLVKHYQGTSLQEQVEILETSLGSKVI
jgi:hypothetical protein